MCAGAIYRTATHTLTEWQPWLLLLNSAVEDSLPFLAMANGALSSPLWDSQPIVDGLAEASQKFPKRFPSLFLHLTGIARELAQTKPPYRF
jgi:hypothetical protein